MELKIEKLMETSVLALRSWATDLFSLLGNSSNEPVIFDFDGVEFMSRSFANEYLMLKSRSARSISERNLSPILRYMMQIASIRPEVNKSHAEIVKGVLRSP